MSRKIADKTDKLQVNLTDINPEGTVRTLHKQEEDTLSAQQDAQNLERG